MIRLTKSGTGEPIYISPEHLVEVRHDEDYAQTLVSTGVMAEGWYVLESPEEVASKVLEWRLAMERYRAAYAEVMRNSTLAGPDLEEAEHDMLKLAGLEEPK